jgi:hypothetical protein
MTGLSFAGDCAGYASDRIGGALVMRRHDACHTPVDRRPGPIPALMRDRSVRWRQNTAQAAEQTLTGRVKIATVGRNDTADHFVPPDEHEAATVLVAVCCAIG